jgi:hypothetical protein
VTGRIGQHTDDVSSSTSETTRARGAWARRMHRNGVQRPEWEPGQVECAAWPYDGLIEPVGAARTRGAPRRVVTQLMEIDELPTGRLLAGEP